MDRGTISTLKRTTPVPAPRALPGGVHHTIRPGFATLQEQMHLEHDRETFLKIVRMIRRTAARHIDLTKSWVWQDPQTLEDIKEEILAQCPLLGDVYVDAWPITSYLRRSLKEHKSGKCKSQRGYGSRSGPTMVSPPFFLLASVSILTFAQHITKPLLNRYAYVAIPSRQGKQKTPYTMEKAKVAFVTSTTSIDRAAGRSDSPSEKAVEDILELSDSECDSEEGAESSLPSSSSGEVHSKICMSGAETASIISATEGSPGIDEYQDDKSDYEVELIEDPDEEYPSPVREEHPMPRAHTARTTVKHPSHVGPPSVNPFAIRDMFISRGLAVADAQRVALLLSSLGIVDMVGLRVLSRLTFCETWISEMRREDSLNEMEAGVIRDVLDTFREMA